MTDIMTLASPPDWQLYRLGQLFRERKEKGSDKDFPPLSVTMSGIVPQLETAAKSDDGENRKVVRVGDYVINSRSDRKGSGGVSAHEGSVSLISIVLEPRNIDPRFAHHLLRSPAFQEEFYRWGHGIVADLWTTRYGDMKNIRLRIPDLATQRQIADFLDRETARIDLLVEKKQRLVGLLGERFNARRNSVFRQIPNSQYRPLRWLLTRICDGPFGSGLTSAHYTDTGVRVVRLQNIKDGGFADGDAAFISEEHYTTLGDHDVKAGDLLVAGLGDEKNKVGRACIAPDGLGPAMVKADCYRVRLKRNLISHHFVAEYLSSDESWPQIDALAKGVTRSRLNLELVRRIRVPVPQMEQQNKIIEQVACERSVFSSASARIIASIARLKEYRSALITAAVTGQIDVSTHAKSGTFDRRLDAIQEKIGA
ncbi:hypothetical protein DD563_13110 [Pelagicola sp. LXJ1103]|nr:hypothetical protein DD563_13110 [Pelagicola sp. LXJ1103]